MADNFLYIPELNPVLFFDVDRANLDKYQTKHFDDFPFEERSPSWMQIASYYQIWQVEDIINLQFESTFDPITVDLLDSNGTAVITLPALIGLPNRYLPNTYAFEVNMALSGLETGCYKLQITAGSGATQKILQSNWQYISATPLAETILMEYSHSRFHKDVMFESGIKFQLRVPGWIDYDRSGRSLKQEVYKDQLYNPALLSSLSTKQIPVYFGDEFGLPTDITNLIEQIWECDNVLIDGKPFGLAEGKLEFIDIEGYRKRGLKTLIEPGINRNSRIFAIDVDPSKKLITSIVVSAKVFGDTGNQGSSNTVPVYNVE